MEDSNMQSMTQTDCGSTSVKDKITFEVTDKDPSSGQVVWGKLGRHRWWPALVIDGYMVLREPAKPNHSWLFWFGDHKISEVPREKMMSFCSNYDRMSSGQQTSALFKRAVLEAVKVFAEQCRQNNLDDKQLINWAEEGFVSEVTSTDKTIPVFIKMELDKMKGKRKEEMEDEEDSDMEVNHGDALDAVKMKTKKIEDVCISCNNLGKEVVDQHPLYNGGLCQQCKKGLIESYYAVGDDGIGSYCSVCSSGGDLFVCGDSNCNSVVCVDCVKLYVGGPYIEKILETDVWLCFLCTPYSTETHGYFTPKSDYKYNVFKMFDESIQGDLHYLFQNVKKKIRVLSLFDGIGTGKLVMDQLGLDVEVYNTSEIDKDSMLTTSYNHGDTVKPLGNIKTLTPQKLKEISPIDLLIGGPPCNDLSLANPGRRGFTDYGSSALLLIDYHRVLKCLQKFSGDRHVFWLLENVASMRKQDRQLISRIFECEPALWDAKFFSPQSRPRLFWGNIPGLYSTPYISGIRSTADLDDIVSQRCNRKATIKIMRTVTTRQNSLKYGKNDSLFPVTMNGEDDMIWVSELEGVFGFPPHYTDVGNIPVTKRRQLLGQSWSVPVIKKILQPLKEYFSTMEV